MGEPQQSSVASVTVFVSHVAATMPPIHLGFAENSYTLQVIDLGLRYVETMSFIFYSFYKKKEKYLLKSILIY